MKHLKLLMEVLFSLPKTVYFNLRVFNFSTAVRLPVLISWKVKIRNLARDVIILPPNSKSFSIRIGFGGTSVMHIGTSELSLPKGGTLEFGGRAQFSRGVCIKNTGKLFIGDCFSANNNLRLTCANSVTIEEKAMLGWNVVIRDSDGHHIIEKGTHKERSGKVHVGKHVWICAEVHLLKGADVGDDCVVAYRSLVTKNIAGNNLMIAGSPAKIIKENITWQQ